MMHVVKLAQHSHAVAVMVGAVGPVDPLVSQHEAVNSVAGIKDSCRAAQLSMPHSIQHTPKALEDIAVSL